jgi:hypothetical protein
MSLPLLQTSGLPDEIHRTQIANAVNELLKGRANNVGSVTLTANVTTTTTTDTRIKTQMKVFLSPKTANAAAALANVYVSAVADGSFTLTHANAATTDRTFDYVFHGG